MNNGLRKHLKQLPYFLLYNYPAKMKTYNTIVEKNKAIKNPDDKLKLNAYHSPSPMNELCKYICEWEKKNVLWNNDLQDLVDTRCLIVNNDIDLSNEEYCKTARQVINQFIDELKKHLRNGKDNVEKNFVDEIVSKYKKMLTKEIKASEEVIANYVIKISYSGLSVSKSLAWMGYGDYIIKNLKDNSNPSKRITIKETPYKTNESYEYLGKYYEMIEGGNE